MKPEQENKPVTEKEEAEVEEEMAVRPVIKLTRQQIYDEVWSVAVSGMALKYSIPYSSLLKQIKDANVPIPPSGYWTKREFNKETTVTPLDGNPDEVIALYTNSATASRERKNNTEQTQEREQQIKTPVPEKKEEITEKMPQPKENPLEALGEPEVEESWGGRKNNVYRREVLYKEVWQFPVTEVAKKYAVSDVTIHKICKSLDIPTPPPGYWAKLRAGKEVTIPPLPKSNGRTEMSGLRNQKIYTQATEEQIAHLTEEDRTAVMAVASQIVMVDEHDKMHPKVAACYKKAKTGGSTDVVDFIAKESVPRAIKILDTLVKAAIPLGIEVDDKLQFSIGKDKVYLRFSETTKEVPHQLTKQEKMALLEYEDAKKQKRWAREPQIRKYDHVYTGTLSLGINDKRRFRDSRQGQIEDRLGEVLVAVFYCINEAKLAREEREEAERKREEERRRQEEIKKRYNEEVAKTKALLNQANDFEIATKIRAMAAAAEANGSASEEWLAWARAKADWYDPTVAATDEFFGKRKHEESEDKKALREKGSYYSYW